MVDKKLSIISGAGISVASGLKTFRGENGLWEGYDIMKVASIEGWYDDPELVLEFYNKRRAQLSEVEPNMAHMLCAMLEKDYDVHVITQNVDDLHERSGSSKVIHLHGELKMVKSTIDSEFHVRWTSDVKMGDVCPKGGQLRPAIVWFGEEVPLMEIAAQKVHDSDVIIIVGTSMQVYPAAGLISFAKPDATIFYVDPDPELNFELQRLKNLRIIEKTAVEGMQILFDHLSE
jgi:NAD-dependent deacetylase